MKLVKKTTGLGKKNKWLLGSPLDIPAPIIVNNNNITKVESVI
jgi:hypothetical protein